MNKKYSLENIASTINQQQQQISSKRPNAYQHQESEEFISEIKCFDVYLNSKGLIQYVCILCGETIENSMNHVLHLRQHFNGALTCKDWKDHFNDNKGFNLYSSSCNEIFDGLYDFINHLNNIHYNKKEHRSKIVEEQMACMYCNQKFDDPHARLEHITMIHLGDDMLHRNISKDIVSTYPTESIIVEWYDKELLNTEQVNTEPSPYNDTWNIPEIVQNNISNKPIKSNNIILVSDITSDKDSLNGEPNYDTSKVKKKRLRSKPRISTQICEYCGKMYKNLHNLTVHINDIHTKLRKYICSVCNKSFSHVSYLKPHMRVHNDEKPFECKLCEKTFRVSGHLTAHMLRHNNIRRHPCTLCEKKFYSIEELRAHLNVHSRVKPYTCDICDTNFRTKDTLRSHRRLHTGEKPYECKVCDKRFPTLAGLYGHTKCNHRS